MSEGEEGGMRIKKRISNENKWWHESQKDYNLFVEDSASLSTLLYFLILFSPTHPLLSSPQLSLPTLLSLPSPSSPLSLPYPPLLSLSPLTCPCLSLIKGVLPPHTLPSHTASSRAQPLINF
jgi:hypothetical protein